MSLNQNYQSLENKIDIHSLTKMMSYIESKKDS